MQNPNPTFYQKNKATNPVIQNLRLSYGLRYLQKSPKKSMLYLHELRGSNHEPSSDRRVNQGRIRSWVKGIYHTNMKTVWQSIVYTYAWSLS